MTIILFCTYIYDFVFLFLSLNKPAEGGGYPSLAKHKKKNIILYLHIATTVTIECSEVLSFVGDSLLQPSSSFKKNKEKKARKERTVSYKRRLVLLYNYVHSIIDCYIINYN